MPKVTSHDLLAVMQANGYKFRMNDCDDTLEVNGRSITDADRAKIREMLRDLGLAGYLNAADDSMLAEADRNRYHPVREYLDSLGYDGQPHIAALAGHVSDVNNKFALYLRHWLIGAVQRAFTGKHHRSLVLDSTQGKGKSCLAKWLCPLPAYFDDSALLPDDKDSAAKALRVWVWEVSEFGATTRRQDLEALKAFLSRDVFRFRPPYGRFEIHKPALASFIGTANDSSGLFGDPTGSRRFMATTIEHINWDYSHKLSVHDVWSEAVAAWRSGEKAELDPTEAAEAETINSGYRFADPVEVLFQHHFPHADPKDKTCWTSTAEILITLQTAGLGHNSKANSMALAATLKRLGFEKARQADKQGYFGVR